MKFIYFIVCCFTKISINDTHMFGGECSEATLPLPQGKGRMERGACQRNAQTEIVPIMHLIIKQARCEGNETMEKNRL